MSKTQSEQETAPLWEVRSSGIHNHGLFATQWIAQGTQIIEYLGERIPKELSSQRALEWEKKARKQGQGLVYIFELNDEWDLDGNVEYNPAKYSNHHCEPNCEAVNYDDHIWLVASRDILANEELTFDYGYAIDSFLDHPCRCGAASCPGYIVRKDQRWRVRRLTGGKSKLAKASSIT